MPVMTATAQICLRARASVPAARCSYQPTRPTRLVQPMDLAVIHMRLLHSFRHHSLDHRPLIAAASKGWPGQLRRQSGVPEGEEITKRSPTPPPRGRLVFVRLLLRAIFTPFRGQSLRGLYQKSPEETVLAVAVLVAFVFIFAYIVHIYYTYFYSRQFTRYPPPVAKHLRRALYFSNYSPDPKRALKNYRLALEQCDALGLDPYSDDVMGIRIQLAAWLEKAQNYEAAIKILELLLGDCQRWVAVMEKSVADGSAKDGDDSLSARLPASPAETKRTLAAGEELPSDVETLWGRRSRILRKAIGISVKLGELYADEHVLNTSLAHDRMVWSVDTALKEFQRRSVAGVKPGEGPWMSPEEMGAALESLGHNYESRSQFHLALPLFFQALRLCQDPCHSAVIMNNLAISFAQHSLQPPYETLAGPLTDNSSATPTPEEARRAYLESAQRWAENAYRHATDPAGAEQTRECAEACAVALCNLGDIAAMMGKPAEARQRLRQARAMSEKLQFAAGVAQADAALQRL